jgi:hypothetical protein
MDESITRVMFSFTCPKEILEQKFCERMYIDPNGAFRVEEKVYETHTAVTVYFFETDENGNFIVGKDEVDFDPESAENEDLSYGEWLVSKFDERIQMAVDWMNSRQDSFFEFQGIGGKAYIDIEIWGSKESRTLDSSFVSACGKLNLPILIRFNYN